MNCVVVGSAQIKNYENLLNECKNSDLVVASDGGILHLKKIGVEPNLFVGDMDSCVGTFSATANTKVITLPKNKDDTDTFFAVKEALKLGGSKFTMFGCLGQRLDHSFGNFCVAKYLSERHIKHKLLADDFEAFVLENDSEVRIKNFKGKTVSVFPFGVSKCKITYSGFEYNLVEGYLEANFPLGISNKLLTNNSKIFIHEGFALVFVYYNF